MLINTYTEDVMKSKFIGLLYDVNDVKEVSVILDNLKKEHPKARHMPYAYIIGPNMRKSDDKEPHNSSGMQIFNQLTMNNLNHHLLVIIRYFGGTKLGAANLLRTYLKVAKNTIK